MSTIDRRAVLRGIAGLGVATALPNSIQQALAIAANGTSGTIEDVKHIVVLMQENRSFDHYFGTLRGVRGFADRRAAKLYGSGNSVFQQPNLDAQGVPQNPPALLPFHPTAANLGQQFLVGLPHAWADAHAAWNQGLYDRWISAKGRSTMAYLQRADIPFYYALADAFTICDAYHCSVMSLTDPNRYYLWSGWCGQNGTLPGGIDLANTGSTPGVLALKAKGRNAGNGAPPNGPVVNNAEAGYSWTTYPERLQRAGISWKIYQDLGRGLSAATAWGSDKNPYIGNYGDNALLYFTQYRNAQPGNPLYERARAGTNTFNGGAFNNGTLFEQLRADVLNNTLPQVSWIAAPEAYSEHSNWPTSYGSWYIDNVLAALTANPAVWEGTVLILCFDENDGFFDHVVPPTPPASRAQGLSTVSTVNELYPGANSTYVAGPYGLGARVPMLVISPWSKGGWVCSQTFDHTSIIQFIERRFGVLEPNITPWRRAICGDLTTALDFSLANPSTSNKLPSTAALAPPAADIASGKNYPTYVPAMPANQSMPVQETGQRLARALPYELHVEGRPHADNGTFEIIFANTGKAGAWLHVRTANDAIAGGSTGPWGYTVESTKSLSETWTTPTAGAYDLAVHGPNGFFRAFVGSLMPGAAQLTTRMIYDVLSGGVALVVTNVGAEATTVTVTDKYTNVSSQQTLRPRASFRSDWTLQASARWYDLVVTTSTDARFCAQLAGHVETGADGASEPSL